MKTELFNYDLPPSFIAQQPAEPRDSSRLLVLERATGKVTHRQFSDVGEYVNPGDMLVLNNSRVIPARLHGHKTTGGAVEVFLLRQLDDDGSLWECLVRGRGLTEGAEITIAPNQSPNLPISQSPEGVVTATITAVHPTGSRTVAFSEPINPWLED